MVCVLSKGHRYIGKIENVNNILADLTNEIVSEIIRS